jgi:cytidylate kinase
VINQAASEAGAPEMALAVIDVLGLLDIRPSAQEERAYQQAVQHVIETLAEQGNVIIIGRAGCVLLQDRRNVLHVRVVAPMSQRIERIVQVQAIPPEAAQAQIEASDRARRAYVDHYYHVDWDDPRLYDLVINMGKLTVAGAAELICLAHARSFVNS